MKQLINRFLPIIKYICFSGMTAVIESVISLLLINFFDLSEVPANTVGIIIGSIIHYLCVTRGVFNGKVNWKTVSVYVSTFIMGMLLQNFVVWGVVKLIGSSLNENLRYLAAKACSLAVSFFLMYFIRKLGYRMVSESENKEA